MRNRTANQYFRQRFGCKVYRIALDGGFTCPNRDGSIDTRGCIFCSGYGSGEFSGNRAYSVTEQIERGKDLVKRKMPEGSGKYIAYFQAFTGTYAPVDKLRCIYEEAAGHPDIVAVAIATRPDCLPDDVLDLIERINKRKPVWIELGLQTIHDSTAEYIRRGYALSVYDDAVKRLSERGIETVTHIILGLPYETREEMLQTAAYVGAGPVSGIKIQLLHVLAGTDLADEYARGKFKCLTMEEYVDLVRDCIKLLPEHIVIHRMTGDGARRDLIAPLWSTDKKRVLNTLKEKLSYDIINPD
ncbi:MAG: TIGR01212 family radical SAM protein [Lachnospiraceae bacterium]|nr:TIGR01212 family radical SAM protein [Lachnospiraceae bacterium]